MLQDLLPQAERIAAKLKARKETVSVAESSTAGMISAALLAIPGASAYFIGGAVVYTRQSRTELRFFTLPSTTPFGTSAVQKKGIRALRRSSGVARHSLAFNAAAPSIP